MYVILSTSIELKLRCPLNCPLDMYGVRYMQLLRITFRFLVMLPLKTNLKDGLKDFLLWSFHARKEQTAFSE